MELICNELLELILKYASTTRKTKIAVKLVCKKFLEISYTIDNVTIGNNSPIRYACKEGKLESVKFLLNNPKVRPSIKKGICLYNACINGYLDIVELLLNDSRVHIIDIIHRLKDVINEGRYTIVEYILKHKKTKIDLVDDSILLTLCAHNIRYLIDYFYQNKTIINENILSMSLMGCCMNDNSESLFKMYNPLEDSTFMFNKIIIYASKMRSKKIIYKMIKCGVIYSQVDYICLFVYSIKVDDVNLFKELIHNYKYKIIITIEALSECIIQASHKIIKYLLYSPKYSYPKYIKEMFSLIPIEISWLKNLIMNNNLELVINIIHHPFFKTKFEFLNLLCDFCKSNLKNFSIIEKIIIDFSKGLIVIPCIILYYRRIDLLRLIIKKLDKEIFIDCLLYSNQLELLKSIIQKTNLKNSILNRRIKYAKLNINNDTVQYIDKNYIFLDYILPNYIENFKIPYNATFIIFNIYNYKQFFMITYEYQTTTGKIKRRDDFLIYSFNGTSDTTRLLVHSKVPDNCSHLCNMSLYQDLKLETKIEIQKLKEYEKKKTIFCKISTNFKTCNFF